MPNSFRVARQPPGQTRTPQGWRPNIWLNNRRLSSTVMLLCWCFISLLGWRGTHWQTGWVILMIYCKDWRMALERYLTANKHVFNLQRRTYSSSVMYCFSFSGSTKDIIFRKRISLKQPERHQEGDHSELNFDVLSNWTRRKTRTCCWINTCGPMEISVPFDIWASWLHGFRYPCSPALADSSSRRLALRN